MVPTDVKDLPMPLRIAVHSVVRYAPYCQRILDGVG